MDRKEESGETRIEPDAAAATAEMNELRRQVELARETIARCEDERAVLQRDVVRDRENLRQLGETLLTTTRNLEKVTEELNEARDEARGTLELATSLHEKNAELRVTGERKERELNELREEAREFARRASDANKAIELMCDLYVNVHSHSFAKETCLFAVALGDGMVNGRCVRFFEIEHRPRGELARMAREMFRESCGGGERRHWFNAAYGTANVLTNWCSPKVLRADRFHLPVGYTPRDFLDPEKDHVLNTAESERFLLLKTSSVPRMLISTLLARGTAAATRFRQATNEDNSGASTETDGFLDLKGVHDGGVNDEDEPVVRRNGSETDDDDDDEDSRGSDGDDYRYHDDSDAETFTRNYVRRILRIKPRLCLALTLRPLTYESPASVRIAASGALRRRAPLVRTAATVYYSTNTDAAAGQVLRAIKELFESVAKTTQRRARNRTRYELVRLLNRVKADARSIAQIQRDD